MASRYRIDGEEFTYHGVVWPTAADMVGAYLHRHGYRDPKLKYAYRLTRRHQPFSLLRSNSGTVTETTEYRPQATVVFDDGAEFTMAFWGRTHA